MLRFLTAAWVLRFLRLSFREWSDRAAANPRAAAEELDAIAVVLEGRARGYRRQDGWRARRDRGIAAALREHAAALRDRATTQRACRTRPGAWIA